MKFKYFALTVAVMSASFYAAVLFFSPGTVQWNGSVDTDWNNAGNWTPLSGSPSIPPNKTENGDHVVIDNTAPNFPVITIPAFARSLTVEAGAKVTVKSGGSLEVIGSDLDGVINEGHIQIESGANMRIDSAFDDGLVNMIGGKLTNSGTFTVTNGTGSRIENADSIINNTGGTFTVSFGLDTAVRNFNSGVIKNLGNFTVSGGSTSQISNFGIIRNELNNFSVLGGLGGTIIVNHLNASIYNAGTFSSCCGDGGVRLDNYSLVENFGTLQIQGAATGKGLINHLNAVFNHQGTDLQITGGKDQQIDNAGLITLNGNTYIFGGAFYRTVINTGTIDQISGTLEISGGDGGELDNQGIVNFRGTTTITGGGGLGITNLINGIGDTINLISGSFLVQNGNSGQFLNNGVFNSYINSTFQFTGSSDAIIDNNSTGIINNFSGTLTSQKSMGVRIRNKGILNNYADISCLFGNSSGFINTSNGRFNHYSGSFTVSNFSDDPGFKNDGEFKGGMSNTISIYYGSGIGLFNSSSFIDSAGCNLSIYNIGGLGSNYGMIENSGTLYLDCSDSLYYSDMNGIINTNTGIFRQNVGSLNWYAIGADLIKNDNYFYSDVPIIKESNGGTQGFIINNSDTVILGIHDTILAKSTGKFINNQATGYIDNSGYWRFSSGSNPIQNAGLFYMRPSSSMKGKNINGHILDNSGMFFNEGCIEYREYGGNIVNNTNYFENTGSVVSRKFSGTFFNSDTILNKGVIELDTSNIGLTNQAFFLNDTAGKIYAD
ncbi:MAG: hypothetical protein KA143_10730, partial [Saprospiraceae bacterium]|nr:hypothetical protein [Saprospiraceae bacterium]